MSAAGRGGYDRAAVNAVLDDPSAERLLLALGDVLLGLAHLADAAERNASAIESAGTGPPGAEQSRRADDSAADVGR